MTEEELAFAGAAEQARLVRSGEVSASELVELCLARIERLDPRLNAFRVVLADRAREEAKAIDRSYRSRKKEGLADRLAREKPFFGVPIALKDSTDLEGEVSMHGTDAFTRPAEADSAMVASLRAAGAIVVGKTHLPELAIFGFTESATWGVTRNPWNDQRSSAGSSGGSATAVAAGMVPVASASDGAGSIRLPSAACGLFGLKPQRGRIPLGPTPDHWYGLSVNGCVSRKVADTALWLDVTLDRTAPRPKRGAPPPDPATAPIPQPPRRPYSEMLAENPGSLRIAWTVEPPKSLFPPILSDEVRNAVAEMAEFFGSLGHRVGQRDPEWGGIGNNMMPRYLGGIAKDVSEVPYPERLERRTHGFARVGRLFPPALIKYCMRQEAADRARIGAIFDEYDVLMTPVMGGTAIPIRKWEGQGALRIMFGMGRYYPWCAAWNHLGNPAASVPAGFGADGLPLAVQLIGRPGEEATLLKLAAQIERERPWAQALPPIR